MDVSISLHEAMILTKLYIILTVFFFICALGGSSADDSIPLMPAEFYGTVYIDNNPAPVGTTVAVLLNGILIDELITIEPGMFGGTGIFDRRLSVIVDDAGAGSQILQFQVNGMYAPGSEEFAPGTSKKIELFVTDAGLGDIVTTPIITALPTQDMTPITEVIETLVPTPEITVPITPHRTPPVTATQVPTETIAPKAPVQPPQSNAIWYIGGVILFIIILNIIVWRMHSRAKTEEKHEEEL